MPSNPEYKPHYERLLVFYNATKIGTAAMKAAGVQIHSLQHELNMPSSTSIASSPDRRLNEEAILAEMRPTDLLLALGGDGTMNNTVSALLREDPDYRPDLLAVPVGTANDFSRNRNGNIKGADGLVRVVRSGHQAEVMPMELSLTEPNADSVMQLHALNNAGIHYTAQMADRIGRPEHRSSKLRATPVVGQLLQDLKSFGLSLGEMSAIPMAIDPSEEFEPMHDVTLVHARLAARYGHYHSSHEVDTFLLIPNHKPSIVTVLGRGALSALGLNNGEARTAARITVGEQSTVGHVDGEVFPVPAGAVIDVALRHDAVKVISTK